MGKLTPTEEALNQLCWDCSKDYGHLYYTADQATPETLAQFRARDLYILQQTVKHLPQITDAKAAIQPSDSCQSHEHIRRHSCLLQSHC